MYLHSLVHRISVSIGLVNRAVTAVEGRYYTVSVKTVYSISGITSSNTGRFFFNSFTVIIPGKFVIKQSLNIPSLQKCVATLPCEKLIVRKLACPVHCGSLAER